MIVSLRFDWHFRVRTGLGSMYSPIRKDIDFSGAAEDAELEFYLGVNIANTDQRPVWNKGKHARLKSLGK